MTMEPTLTCICGLPATGFYSAFGAFCSQDCHGVAVYMDRCRAKERMWMQNQYAKNPKLREILEELEWEHKLAVMQHSS